MPWLARTRTCVICSLRSARMLSCTSEASFIFCSVLGSMSRAYVERTLAGFATAFCTEGGVVALGGVRSVTPSGVRASSFLPYPKFLFSARTSSGRSSEDCTRLPGKCERRSHDAPRSRARTAVSANIVAVLRNSSLFRKIRATDSMRRIPTSAQAWELKQRGNPRWLRYWPLQMRLYSHGTCNNLPLCAGFFRCRQDRYLARFGVRLNRAFQKSIQLRCQGRKLMGDFGRNYRITLRQ